MSKSCKVCGKRLRLSGNTDGLCREHHFEEGNVWVLEFDFDADYYLWKPKFPAKTLENEVRPDKGAAKNEL
jgi:hypothetical protein